MTRARAFDGGSDKVAMISGASFFIPGFDEMDFIKNAQRILDEEFPTGMVEQATEKILSDIAEVVHMVAAALNRRITATTEGAQIIVSGPRIRWTGEIPVLDEFQPQMINLHTLYPKWERDGEWVIPTVLIWNSQKDLREVGEWKITSDFGRCAKKIADWQTHKDDNVYIIRTQHMSSVSQFLPLFYSAVDTLRALGVTSSTSLSFSLKGFEFWLGKELKGDISKTKLTPEGKMLLEVPESAMHMLENQSYTVAETRPDVQTFIEGRDHQKEVVSGGQIINGSIMTRKEASAISGIDLYHIARL